MAIDEADLKQFSDAMKAALKDAMTEYDSDQAEAAAKAAAAKAEEEVKSKGGNGNDNKSLGFLGFIMGEHRTK